MPAPFAIRVKNQGAAAVREERALMLHVVMDELSLTYGIVTPHEFRALTWFLKAELVAPYELTLTRGVVERTRERLKNIERKFNVPIDTSILDGIARLANVYPLDMLTKLAKQYRPELATKEVGVTAVATGANLIVAQAPYLLAAGEVDGIPVCGDQHFDELLKLDLTSLDAPDSDLESSVEEARDAVERLVSENKIFSPRPEAAEIYLSSDTKAEFKAKQVRRDVFILELERRRQVTDLEA